MAEATADPPTEQEKLLELELLEARSRQWE
jgi:hypothetical protein